MPTNHLLSTMIYIHLEGMFSVFTKKRYVLCSTRRTVFYIYQEECVPYSPRKSVFHIHQQYLCSVFTKKSCVLCSDQKQLFSTFTKKSFVLCSSRKTVFFVHKKELCSMFTKTHNMVQSPRHFHRQSSPIVLDD